MAIKQLIALCLLLAYTYAESNPEADADADAYYGGPGYYHHGYYPNHFYSRPYAYSRRPYAYPRRPVYKKPYFAPKPAPYKTYTYKTLGPVEKPVPAPEPYRPAAPVAAPVPSPAPYREPEVVAYEAKPVLKTFPAVPEEPVLSYEPEPEPYVQDPEIEVIGAPEPVNAVPAVVPQRPVAAPIAPVPAPAPGLATQYHAQDEFGNVEYGYSNANSAKQERRDSYGNVIGQYSYDDGTGYPKHVSYIADDFGFRITSANNLPVARAV